MEGGDNGPLLAGQQPSFPAVATGTARLHLSLLRDLQRVVDLDAEVSDNTLKFAVTQEKLDGPEIPGAPIDQRRFGTPQRMSAVGSRIQSNRRHPRPDDSGILPRRKMRRLRNAARKYELLRLQMSGCYPSAHRAPRLLGDFELHRPLGFLLHDNRTVGDMTALDHIVDAKRDQITPAQLAVDGKVEQCEFPGSLIQLQPNPDGPNLLQLQRRLLAEQFAFVLRYCMPRGRSGGIHERLLC